MPIASLGIIIAAALLAFLGARWTRGFDHYEEQRRAIPRRDAVAVALATLGAALSVAQGGALLSQALLALWSVVFAIIVVVDIETHFIPNRIILPATALALLASLVDPRLNWKSSLLGTLIGFVLFYLIAWVARGGFGMGDVKLSAFMGAVAGVPAILYALVAGIFIGGLVAGVLLATKRVGRRSFIPYGPALCLGGWLGMMPAVWRFWGLG